MTAETLFQIRQTEQQRQAKLKNRIMCCTVAGCLSCGAEALRHALESEVGKQGRAAEIEVCGTGCLGLCSEGPLVRSTAADVIFTRATPDDAPAIVAVPSIPIIRFSPASAASSSPTPARPTPSASPITSRKAVTARCFAP